jgi:dTMP kinase
MECGLFVTIDGIGGAGKTTVAQLSVEQLQAQGRPALYTREPSDSDTGRFLREQVGSLRGHALACLVAADRFDHVATVVAPAVERGTIVVCDRYVASSLVLQPLDGVPEAYVEQINAPAQHPDLAVVLLAAAETAWARVSQRGSHGRFEEGIEQSHAEYRAYRRVATSLHSRGWNIHTVDADDTTAPQVAVAILELIDAAHPPGDP